MKKAKRSPAPPRADHRMKFAIVCALAVITLALFSRTFTYPFINFDDPAYILERAEITRGVTLAGIEWSFTHPHGGNWHPLTSFSHMLDCQLFDGHAGAHHLVNVVLHTLTVCGLFLVLAQMTGAGGRSMCVALLFALHPLRVESVAWIAERKDVLSGLFFVLTIASYFRYLRSKSVSSYLIVLVSLGLGLMAKPILVTTPFVLLLLDYWPLRRFEKTKRHVPDLGRILLEKVPMLLLVGGSACATVVMQREGLSSIAHVPLNWRIGNALVSYFIYLGKMIWPTDLAFFYPYPATPFRWWEVCLVAVVLVAISALAWFLRRTRPYFLTGWFWYVGMLVPVIGLVQAGRQGHADRYTYLPEIGLAIILVWGIDELLVGFRYRKQIATTSMVLVCAMLISCTWIQLGYWRDSEAIWNRTIAVTENNDVAHAYLADLLLRQNRIAESQTHAEEALRIQPGNSDAQNNLALALFRSGRLAEAREHWQRSLELKPDNINAECNYAWLLATAPSTSLRDGTRALQLINDALARGGNDNPAVLRVAGAAYAETGQFDQAIAKAEEALQLTRVQRNAALSEDLELNIASYRKQTALRDPGVFER